MRTMYVVISLLFASSAALADNSPTRTVSVPPGEEIVIPYRPGTTPICGKGVECIVETNPPGEAKFVPVASSSPLRLRLGPTLGFMFNTPLRLQGDLGLTLELLGPHYYVYGSGEAGYSGLVQLRASLGAGYEAGFGLRVGGRILADFAENFQSRGGEALQARLVGVGAELGWAAKKYFVISAMIGVGQEGHLKPGGRTYSAALFTGLTASFLFDLLGNGNGNGNGNGYGASDYK